MAWGSKWSASSTRAREYALRATWSEPSVR